MSTKKGIVLGFLVAVAAFAGRASAEPSYLVYPSSPAVFRFDASRYELVSPGDPRFDSKYLVAGQMLWDRVQNRIPVELYRAPVITGFQPSPTGQNEFVTVGNDFTVIVDGFATGPHTLGNLCLRFWPAPPSNLVQVFVNGQGATSATMRLPSVDVHTSIGGGYYSDTGEYHVTWIGASGVEIVAFSDKDANGSFEGVPAYRIIAQDNVVPTKTSTWGGVKALYR